MVKNNTKFKETELGPIPEEWGIVKSGEVFEVFTGKKDVNETVVGGKYVFFSCSPDEFRSNDYIFDGPAIIITGNGSYTGTTRFYEGKFDLYQRTYGVVLKKEKEQDWDIKFLYYYFKIFFEREFIGGSRGSSIPYIVRGNIENFSVPLLPINEQKSISSILSSLDDKIELNRQINANLEKTASALFKRWFVDFEFPDKNGKPYKSSGGKMVESEMGEIPEGWKISPMTNFVDIGKGLSYKGSDLNDEGKDVLVGLKCFERGGGFKIDGIKRFSGEFKKQNLLNPGELILAMTDLTQGAEVLGKPAIVPNIDATEHIIASLDVSILRPNSPQFSKAYLYLLFMRQEMQDYLFGYSNGSTVLHLSVKGLNNLKLLVGEGGVMLAFNRAIEPIFDQIQVLNNEVQNLRQTRDLFLPRLMSGKIRTA